MDVVQPAVAFVIPLPHPARVLNWDALIARVEQTVASIEKQSDRNWEAVIVANHHVALPDLPNGWIVERLDAAAARPGTGPSDPGLQMADDRPERVRRGIERVRESRFTIVVEPGDFVSSDLVAFVRRNDDGPGWRFDHGYVWPDGSRFLFKNRDFSAIGATCQIVRTAFYDLTDDIGRDGLVSVPSLFGDTGATRAELERLGTPLRPLPFAGAIHRLPNARQRMGGDASSSAGGRTLISIARNALGLRILTAATMARFGIDSAGSSDVVEGMHPATRTVDLG